MLCCVFGATAGLAHPPLYFFTFSRQVSYGTHMAIAMGIGLLFLGGGMASLGREKEHIAALLGAFFPR